MFHWENRWEFNSWTFTDIEMAVTDEGCLNEILWTVGRVEAIAEAKFYTTTRKE